MSLLMIGVTSKLMYNKLELTVALVTLNWFNALSAVL